MELKEFVRLPSYLPGNVSATAIIRGLGYSRKIARKNRARIARVGLPAGSWGNRELSAKISLSR